MSNAQIATFSPTAQRVTTDPCLLPLRVRDLGLKCAETSILHGLDLDLAPHGCTVIMGPNGAGKSMLLKLLHGLIQPTAGRIEWGSRWAARSSSRA